MSADCFRIIEGAEYLYVRGHPIKCHGHRYLAHRVLTDVPSYQPKVLVECLSGPDAGLWFTVSLANFAMRYQLVREPEPEPAAVERVAGPGEEQRGKEY